MSSAGTNKRTKVFVSYSHSDPPEALERLQKHLAPLVREGLDLWVDTQMKPGEEWKDEIKKALNEARVAILLISADFIASEFITEDELPPILMAAEKEGLVVLPVILSPCRFSRTPSLNRFRAVNNPLKPLSKLSFDEREEVWDRLSIRVEDILGMGSAQNSSQEIPGQTIVIEEAVEQRQRAHFRKLEVLLKSRQWRKADHETYLLMIDIVGKKEPELLDRKDFEKFPCDKLREIDGLWLKYSKGHWGFSVQKKIWQECGSPTEFNKFYHRFGRRVGWKILQTWIKYDDFSFELNNSEKGHLPAWACWVGQEHRQKRFSFLAERAVKCNLNSARYAPIKK